MRRRGAPPLIATETGTTPRAFEDAAPVSDDEFISLMAALGPFEPAPHLAVAVSGGGDSLALLLLANAWAQACGGRILALTVDHGLRPESAAEASQVAEWARARGIEHRTLVWEGEKPKTRVMEKARTARLSLLEESCAEAGILHLLLAHHADDQAETMALRREDKSGAHGLAGMSEQRFTRRVRLVRPLLAFPKHRLLATCRALGQGWIEDPSNRDRRYARARLRAEGGLTSRSQGQAVARTQAESEAAKLAAACVVFHPLGFAEIDRAVWGEADHAIAAFVLARVVLAVGGAFYGLSPALREEAGGWARTGEWRATRVARITLGRCLLRRGLHRITVIREARNLLPPVDLVPGTEMNWDRRVSVTAHEEGWMLGAFGLEVAPDGRELDPAASPLPADIRASLPVLRSPAGRSHSFERRFAELTVSAPSNSPKTPQIQFTPPRSGFPAAFTVVWPTRRIMF